MVGEANSCRATGNNASVSTTLTSLAPSHARGEWEFFEQGSSEDVNLEANSM